MLPLVLRRLEALQADLATIDPAGEIDAADRVASMATALRDVLAESGALGAGLEVSDGARTAAAIG